MKETFLLRMPEEIKQLLADEAAQRGLSLNGLIMAILSEYCRKKEVNRDVITSKHQRSI
jgi:predicted HicB family RNase H-like nuclease|nr:MAG TPA: hypothetical protein [Caudoviricetes sp.]